MRIRINQSSVESLPCAPDAEETILACMLESPSLITEFMEAGGDSLIYHAVNSELWRVLKMMFSQGETISWLTFRQKLSDLKMVDANGRIALPDGVTSTVIPSTMFPEALAILKDKAVLRSVYLNASAIKESALDHQADMEKFRRVTQEALSKISGAIQPPEDEQPWEQIVDGVQDDWKECVAGNKKSCLPSPWAKWDTHLGGIRKGMTLVLGPRKVGKSSLLGHIAAHLAIRMRQKAMIVSYETSRDDYIKRLVCNVGQVEGRFMFTPDLQPMTEAVQLRVNAAMQKIRSSPLRIINGRGLNAHDIAHEVRKFGPSFVGVDYLMLMGKLPEVQHKEGTERIVAANSAALFGISREVDGAVMVLNHTAEQGDRAGESRWSSQPENDSDLTLLIEEGQIYVKSMRNGEAGGRMNIAFDAPRYRFTEAQNPQSTERAKPTETTTPF